MVQHPLFHFQLYSDLILGKYKNTGRNQATTQSVIIIH